MPTSRPAVDVPSHPRALCFDVRHVLIWNMAAGYDHDAVSHERAWEFVRGVDPDVALLQEAVVPEWARDHWPSVVHCRRYPPIEARPGVPWGCAIVSKIPGIQPLEPDESTPWVGTLWGAVVAARLPPPDGLWLASIHSNAYELSPERLSAHSIDGIKRCDPQKIWEIELAASELARVFAHDRFLLGGDLNSSLLFDLNYNRQSNRKLFENLDAAGFKDLRRTVHEEEQRTYFMDGRDHYQLDHVFGDARTAEQVRLWRVLSDVAEVHKLSDHAPIEVLLERDRSDA